MTYMVIINSLADIYIGWSLSKRSARGGFEELAALRVGLEDGKCVDHAPCIEEENKAGGNLQLYHESAIRRLSAQAYNYGLLIHLHLPNMMHGISSDLAHEYSKITCQCEPGNNDAVIAHQTFNPKSSCSRPVDFFALLAAMALLLAPLNAHRHQKATNVLDHNA
ncbi:hypothetical protein KXV92_001691 [Aspergillus fumigatus]|nr:hypothetical protein KXX11_000182 [Aspergillus fumigatus]KAH1488980.1 hypothetical protein KXX42_001576 [Aspergillus fumigatus]KAH1547776.1 hypothetical protein KXX57_002293 [Aspergillus fumigatus]KAH1581430.1 hypothetical protein KXX17_000661 [Aspergillus fumigatus]KAH1663748.1 hypothetical protein KXX15_009299 [Aspergillus fumigatus]